MKASILWLGFFSFLSLGLADGLVVFRNGGITFRTPGDRKIRTGSFGSPGLTGTNYVAQLYYGPGPETLQPASEPPARFRASTTSPDNAGTWVTAAGQSPMCVLRGYNPGDTVWLQVAVWDSARFATYEAAVAGGEPAGGLPVTYTIPGPEANAGAYYMENFLPNLPPEVVSRMFPAVRVGGDVVISWYAHPFPVGAKRLYRTIGTTAFHWQPVSPAPTNGILKVPMTGEIVLFSLGPATGDP